MFWSIMSVNFPVARMLGPSPIEVKVQNEAGAKREPHGQRKTNRKRGERLAATLRNAKLSAPLSS